MKAIIINHPDEINHIVGSLVRLTQKNRIEVEGRLASVNIREKEPSLNALTIEQDILRTTQVGKLRRDGGLAIATVYLKNVAKIELI